jgi:hypothetical protein
MERKPKKPRREGYGIPITGDYTVMLKDGTRGEIRKVGQRCYLLLPDGNRIVPRMVRIKRRRKA